MHRHKRFRHGPRPFRPFYGIFWLIVLGMIFSGGKWWPALLVLVGLGIVFSSLFREAPPVDPPQMGTPPYVPPVAPPVQPTPRPVEPTYCTDLLPTSCPRCGGPVRAHEVKWLNPRTAACAYCGSALPMKQS